jgi:hypothetical protein
LSGANGSATRLALSDKGNDRDVILKTSGGAAAFSNSGVADIFIDRASTVTGGWQTDIASAGADTARPSAGVLIGSGGSTNQLTNLSTISAASDRAIADIGRYRAGAIGNLVVDNGALVTGFVELAAGGTNTFNNHAGGLFDVRHFADTDGGVSLQIDGRDKSGPSRFSTCLPSGCFVPLTFDGGALATLRTAQKLNLHASAVDGKEMSFAISLKGFAPALDRTIKLLSSK